MLRICSLEKSFKSDRNSLASKEGTFANKKSAPILNDSFEYSKINFASRPGGNNCTRILRPDLSHGELTEFVIGHFYKRILNKNVPKIKVVSHFSSDGSELYTQILRLIKSLGFDTVKRRFIFEARDYDAQIIKEAHNKEILLIKNTLDGSSNDFERLEKEFGKSIEINGKNVSVFDLFKPKAEVNTDVTSELFGFQSCEVLQDLADLVKFKREDIKDFSDKNVDIMFARNQFSHLFENDAKNEYSEVVKKLNKGMREDGILITSKYDLARFGLKEKCEALFHSISVGLKGDVIYKKSN